MGRTVHPRDLFEGFEQARERFANAIDKGDELRTYFGLFEALNWAVALDERIARSHPAGWDWRDQVSDGAIVRALRHARNRVHHDWADALWTEALIVLQADTMLSADTLLGDEDSWVWRQLSELPPAGRYDREGESEYDKLLAGTSARATLDTLSRVFEAVLSSDPPRP